jgi:hypothetical protein
MRRLALARTAIESGLPLAQAAAHAGFADQATRHASSSRPSTVLRDGALGSGFRPGRGLLPDGPADPPKMPPKGRGRIGGAPRRVVVEGRLLAQRLACPDPAGLFALGLPDPGYLDGLRGRSGRHLPEAGRSSPRSACLGPALQHQPWHVGCVIVECPAATPAPISGRVPPSRRRPTWRCGAGGPRRSWPRRPGAHARTCCCTTGRRRCAGRPARRPGRRRGRPAR